MARYRIPWFYIGDTHCLLSTNSAAAEPGRVQLKSDYASLDFQSAQNWQPADPPATPPTLSPYMADIYNLSQIQARKDDGSAFEWKRKPMSFLAVRAANLSPSDLAKEYVLTPTSLYLPWPFFDGSPSGWTPPSGAAATVVNFDVSTVSGAFICLSAMYDAVDVLAECPTAHPAIMDIPNNQVEEAIRAKAKEQGVGYYIGSFTAKKDPNRYSHETHIVVDSDEGTLQVVIGAKPKAPAEGRETTLAEDSDTSAEGTPPGTILIAEYPCGGFTGNDRSCS